MQAITRAKGYEGLLSKVLLIHFNKQTKTSTLSKTQGDI